MPYVLELQTVTRERGYYGGGPDLVRNQKEAKEFTSWGEAEQVRKTIPAHIFSRILLLGSGFLVRVTTGATGVFNNSEPNYRYVAQDHTGWHTTRRENGYLFPTREAAQEMADVYLHHEGADPTLEWVGPEVPSWVEPGARVNLGGGPAWTIDKIEGIEVHLTPPEGGPAVVWDLSLFADTWTVYRSSRFDRLDRL